MYKVSKERYNYYLNNQDEFTGMTHMRNYKEWFLEEQNGRCAICGIKPIWNNKELHFILDHINGDSDDNHRNNLRMICPNCDSQLDTYKSKNKSANKNSSRSIGRKLRYNRVRQIMEPNIGNNISVHDDNVEILTDNADDNDVGMS